MKVIQNKLIPFKGFKYINLFGLILTRDKSKITDIEYNHEKIHLKQMQEMLWLPFHIWYLIEYLVISTVRLFDKQNERYHDISFEEEAYANESNLDYCNERQHFAWLKYIKIGGNKEE